MIYRDEIKQHLKKLKQIKRDLKKPGTPLRKRDRIDVKHTTYENGRKTKHRDANSNKRKK